MKTDVELKHWQSLWQTETQTPADLVPSRLREKAQRQLRHMRVMVFADVGVTVLMGGASLVWAITARHPSVATLALWVWLTIVVAWVFRWFNDKGNWTGAAPNTHVLLELMQKRCRANLRNLKFGWALGVVQLLFSSAWVYVELSRQAPLTLWQFLTLKASLIAWCCVALLFGWSLRLFRKLKSELSYMQHFGRDWNSLEDSFEAIPGVAQNSEPRARHAFVKALADFPSLLERRWHRKKRTWKI